MQDRRSEPRFMCADLVKIRIEEAAGVREVVANLEDISPSGAGIQMEVAALEGAEVGILCASGRLNGKVRYCRFDELGFQVGIAFAERRSWTPKRFLPKHLLRVPVSNRASAR